MKTDLVIQLIEKWSLNYIKMDCKEGKCYGVLAVRHPCQHWQILGLTSAVDPSYLLRIGSLPSSTECSAHWLERHP